MKKKLIKIGYLTFISLPILSIVSCSSSWATWKKSGEEATSIDYKTKIIGARDEDFKTNDYVRNFKFDKTKVITIDLNKLKNQFNLIRILGKIINLKPTKKDVDDFYNDYAGLKTYMTNLNQKLNIQFQFNTKVSNIIKLDISDEITSVIKGLDEYQTPSDKSFDVTIKGINSKKLPIDISGVANAGISFIKIPIVNQLLKVDSNMALRLSKMVNMPKISFEAFKKLMSKFDELFNNIMNEILVNDSALFNWYNTLDRSMSWYGLIDTSENVVNKQEYLDELKGLFLSKNLIYKKEK